MRINILIICFNEKILRIISPVILKIFIIFFVILNILIEAHAIPGNKKKTVIFGGDAFAPPYEYLDENKIPKGYCVDITRALAEEIGWNAEIILGKWEDMIKDLNSGKIHVAERTVYTSDRSKIYNFSLPYHEFRGFIFINSSDINNFNQHQLGKMTAVVQTNSFPAEYIRTNMPYNIIIEKDSIKDVLLYLSAEKNSFTLLNKYTGLYYIETSGIKNVIAADDPVRIGQYHYVSLKKNSELIAAINEGLNALKNKGILNEINNKWFGVIGENKKYNMNVMIIFIVITMAVVLYLIWLVSSQKKKIEIQGNALSEVNGSRSNGQSGGKEKTTLLFAETPVGIYHFDMNGIITRCNESFAGIMGFSKEKITGMNLLSHNNEKLAELAGSALQGIPGYYEGEY